MYQSGLGFSLHPAELLKIHEIFRKAEMEDDDVLLSVSGKNNLNANFPWRLPDKQRPASTPGLRFVCFSFPTRVRTEGWPRERLLDKDAGVG